MVTTVGKPTDDTITGTRLADNLSGQAGNDTITGGLGNDQIDGGEGNDWLEGGADNDIIFGGTGDDELFDGTHDDTLYGGIGDDRLHATQGYDTLDGGAGNDTLDGGSGYVNMSGGDGNDNLTVGQGGGSMTGGAGDDIMRGNIASDSLISEEKDADTFYVDASDGNFGFDYVTGFNGGGQAGGDVLRLEGFERGDVTITETYSFGGIITYNNVVLKGDSDAVDTSVVADQPVADALTTESSGTDQVAKYTSLYGPPTSSQTVFSSAFGTITVDEIGLREGTDYIFDFA